MGSRQTPRTTGEMLTVIGEMEIWAFDRSGCYSPGAFDIHKKPERFIQVIAGYTMMNDEELGLDTFTERNGDAHLIHIEQEGSSGLRIRRIGVVSPSFHGRPRSESQRQTFSDWPIREGVEGIAELIGHRRITSINEMRSGLTFTKPYSFRGLPSTWSTCSRSFSRSRPPSALSRSFSELPGSSIADKPLRKRKSVDVSQKSSKRSRSNSQRSSQRRIEAAYDVEETRGASLLASNNGPYDNRVFRCLVISPAGRAIQKYDKKSELLEALRDAIKATQVLIPPRQHPAPGHFRE
ncbi:hypothetical protein C2857_005218 [Epichloe festucae Fl1]|uniref:Fungal-type protein kinase domain-containing protein n=1 Tax=Epichloe festucae (strain Fl1) TaxID=877507 RepID=A0A7S9KSK7_EPIFF|nr:hypothetical protein C2857_005218 [Epichloe festucae Fl1]